MTSELAMPYTRPRHCRDRVSEPVIVEHSSVRRDGSHHPPRWGEVGVVSASHDAITAVGGGNAEGIKFKPIRLLQLQNTIALGNPVRRSEIRCLFDKNPLCAISSGHAVFIQTVAAFPVDFFVLQFLEPQQRFYRFNRD